MSSLSLPRVLQQRKTSLELERENFEKFQAISIGKAINQAECPVKEKHVRSAIIGTFQDKNAQTFWICVLRLPLQDNLIVCWKFCHVLHKVLREGHPQVIPNSQKHRSKIEDFGKLWGHLKEGYGKLIQHYCHLLITKLDFHRRNPRFPGNLQVTKEELESIGENDINNYFQMSVEMFDYMDDLLTLQTAIFGSLDMSRSNSMTSCGQCRLAPLIPCIQDSSQLYDYCVKILFRLHASLPPDTLSGHRDRFLKQFRVLRQFYLNASTLQYFKNLIQVPLLPENPPNFLEQADLRSYVTPVVILPPETTTPENEPADGSLVDTSDAGSTMGDLVDLGYRNGSVSPDRDHFVEQLQQEIVRLNMELQRQLAEHHMIVEQLSKRIIELETQLARKDSELIEEKHAKEDLLLQTEVVGKYQESEKKAKSLEDKFHKLKDVYQQLREEHIQLIRQKADVDKQLVTAKNVSDEAEKCKVEVEAKLHEMLVEKNTTHQSLQKAASEKEEEMQIFRAAQEKYDSEKRNILSNVERITNEKSILESELQDLLAQNSDLDVRLQAAEDRVRETENRLHQDVLDKLYNLLVMCVTEAEVILEQALNEIDNPAISALTCTPDYFSGLTVPSLKSLADLSDAFHQFLSNPTSIEDLLRGITKSSHLLASYLIHGKTMSNTSPDIEFGDNMTEVCRSIGRELLVLFCNMKRKDKVEEVSGNFSIVNSKIEELMRLVDTLTNMLKGDTPERIGDMVDDELTSMDKAIEEAAARIEEMLNRSRAAHSGVKLEVNEKILDSCTSLMHAIRILVQKSQLLQAEIVAQGKGTASAREFYKRNHRWTEGFISAAKAVGMGAKFLMNAADKVVNGQGKFEQLVVASQEISASTAQLVVASRVKANRGSPNLSALSHASRGVTEATGGVVATAKSCSQLVEESEELDVSGLSLHQAKRLEMESQVRVLELESTLQQERERFSALRRHHYQLAGEMEGWEEKDMA